MSRLSPLPRIMVAPNGARRGKADHPALPITIEETVSTACACFEAGADALHAHVRDRTGRHCLDAGAYGNLIALMRRAAPDMPVQITTEAVGLYSPEQQRQVVMAVNPEGASVALREMWPGGEDGTEAIAFYETCARRGIAIQHILYSPDDLHRLVRLAQRGDVPSPFQAIYVLGRYGDARPARPADLSGFLGWCQEGQVPCDWAICAFGQDETPCLLAAHEKGGKMRIGFENNLHHPDGRLASSNASRVAELVAALARCAPA